MTNEVPHDFDHEKFHRQATRKPNAVVTFVGSLLVALLGFPQETARRHEPAPGAVRRAS
ncbi:hypothetical protein ACSHWB_14575 [Lentzea sp. HUAS TT2]|uniref:hypothetical protein n=1 Tax=Lentzea sp. HUAS TT2 TaxID=3447454 RepID=UPI003F7090E0